MTTTEHETTEVGPFTGVVVGDDGSASADVAVRAAREEARRRDAPLHVVRAWSVTTAVRPADVPSGIVPSLREFEAATREAEEARVAALLGADAEGVEVHVVHSPAAKALLTASKGADLLVVAPRGVGGFRNLMLGSVADQCVSHAETSVLVVR